MSGLICPGTSYETHNNDGSQARSLYHNNKDGMGTPGVVCLCNGTEQALSQGASKTDSFRGPNQGSIVTAREFCCGKALEVLRRMQAR